MSIRFPNGITPQTFMRDFWQQKPLLLRDAMPAGLFPLTGDELAGLACEEELESRLIIGQGSDWTVRHGPFSPEDFARLPESHWTLLVQDVDKYVPDVTRLLDAFDFVPQWRIDDIMISFASDGGGVGPHVDAYDVFLMQGYGNRRWRISERAYADTDLLSGMELRILGRFDTDHDWILEPGDILYLPPGVAHWGTADGDCMTYSLGFRSPNQQELAGDWFQHLVSLTDERHRLGDPPFENLHMLGQLGNDRIAAAADLFRRLPSSGSDDFATWLGCHLTEPKPQFQLLPIQTGWEGADLDAWLESGRGFVRHPWARLCWRPLCDGRLALFVNGEQLTLAAACRALVDLLCSKRRPDAADIHAVLPEDSPQKAALLELINLGVIEPEGTLQ
jgi:50S ribosomal protein L16 3-hydroxylase